MEAVSQSCLLHYLLHQQHRTAVPCQAHDLSCTKPMSEPIPVSDAKSSDVQGLTLAAVCRGKEVSSRAQHDANMLEIPCQVWSSVLLKLDTPQASLGCACKLCPAAHPRSAALLESPGQLATGALADPRRALRSPKHIYCTKLRERMGGKGGREG